MLASPESSLLEHVSRNQPDLLLIVSSHPSTLLLSQLEQVTRDHPLPVLLLAQRGDSHCMRTAVHAGVALYALEQDKPSGLAPLLEMACVSFEFTQQLKDRLSGLEQQLADRKIIEKAKGLLMMRRGLQEAEAYALLRTEAMRCGLRLVELSRQLLQSSALLGDS
ncbi:ANTAR domain-containing response regulator [Leeia sp.]|uniref:ANTAR domain-containing response regulator n=1 Tax=Leeia sp. TaxID=2884678 RepID=UPI0035AD7AF8